MGYIKFEDNDFTVKDSKNFNDIGEFRVICYNTGYYALQKFDEINLRWVTLYICPFKDNVNGYNLVCSLLDYFDLAENSLNNELLNIYFQFPDEEYKEVICKDELKGVVRRVDDVLFWREMELDKFMRYIGLMVFCIFLMICLFCIYYLV